MNILVLKPCCLGDVLMTTPLVGTLRAAYPEARIDYAVGEWARPAVATSPDIDEVLPLFDTAAPRLRRLLQALRSAFRLRWRRYDLAFVPDRSPMTALVAYFAGVPRRVGIAGRGRAAFLTHAVPDAPQQHDVDVYLRLATAAGVDGIKYEMKYVPTQAALEKALHYLQAQGFDEMPFRLALFPGGGSSS